MSTYTLTSTPAVPMTDPSMQLFDKALQHFHAHTPLQYFHWDLTSPTPPTFAYRILAADARTWNQTYVYDGSVEQPLLSTTSALWSLPEIDLHRAVREQVLALYNRFGITQLRATFS